MITEKNSQVPFLTMGELCLESGNKKLAIQAIRREKKYESKVNALIETGAWLEAVEETFSNKKHSEFEDFVERIQREGPSFVNDFIKDAMNKKK